MEGTPLCDVVTLCLVFVSCVIVSFWSCIDCVNQVPEQQDAALNQSHCHRCSVLVGVETSALLLGEPTASSYFSMYPHS